MNSEGRNLLGDEQSPYLRQHKDNPIWWHPWGENALNKALKEEKPIFLSIGYSTCHWCHVMAHATFEDEEVAELLNRKFICIKVDREEHPEIDRIYTHALMAIQQGRAGWPISMFLFPDTRPFFGAGTMMKDQFIAVAERVAELWEKERDALEENGDKLVQLICVSEEKQKNKEIPPPETVQDAYVHMEKSFDNQYGGFGGAPKFPQPGSLSLLLYISARLKIDEAEKMALKTLDMMARGGIRDHVGGGFHRYSVDVKWFVPHFEKMLYDNAQLADTYCDACQLTGNREYLTVACDTLDYLLRDMQAESGGFYAGEDADSEKTEGKFYLWSEEELKEVLNKEELQAIRTHYQVTAEGNFRPDKQISHYEVEAGLTPSPISNILHLAADAPLPEKEGVVADALAKLLQARSSRVRPSRDEKILTGWNGLTITALTKGYRLSKDERYLKAAQDAADFLLNTLRNPEGLLFKRFCNGEIKHRANVDDYAFLIFALLQLYQTDFNPKWYIAARELQQKQEELFGDEKRGGYFLHDGEDKTILTREKTYDENVTPTGNSLAIHNLMILAKLGNHAPYMKKAEQCILRGAGVLIRFPANCPSLLTALAEMQHPSALFALVGDPEEEECKRMIDAIRERYLPGSVLAVAEGEKALKIPVLKGKAKLEGRPTLYPCFGMLCLDPIIGYDALKETLKELQSE